MTITSDLQPERLAQALQGIVTGDIHSGVVGDSYFLDTPYDVGHGYLLRAYFTIYDNRILVSDGGFAETQVEIFSRSQSALRYRQRGLKSIANKLSLTWNNGEFSYSDTSVDEAVRRLAVLAQAVQQGHELAMRHIQRNIKMTTDELVKELMSRGVAVRSDVPITVPSQPDPIRVALTLERAGHMAVVDFLGGTKSAKSQVERIVTDFHILNNSGYQASLFAVYDEESAFQLRKYRTRFENAKPEKATILSSDDAPERITEALKAA